MPKRTRDPDQLAKLMVDKPPAKSQRVRERLQFDLPQAAAEVGTATIGDQVVDPVT